jgi:tetratricopeptide (TPR) repeat protein
MHCSDQTGRFAFLAYLALCALPSVCCAQVQPAVTTTSPAAEAAQANHFSDPVVARMEMKLTLDGSVVETIAAGDLLTVLGELGETYVIATINGQKGSIAKAKVARLADSVRIYDALIEAQPKAGRLYALRAGAHWAIADNDLALADFNKAIELGYVEPLAYSSRGLFLAAMGEYDAALADYTRAVEKDVSNDVLIVNRASVYMSMGKYEDAVQDYNRAIEANGRSAVYFQQRAIAQKLLGNVEKAIADYDIAVGMDPSNVAAWMGRGFIKFQLGKHHAAIDDFSKVIELAPGTAVAYNNRGFNYQLLKQYAKAAKDYQAAVKLLPNYLLAMQNQGWLLTTCEDQSVRDPALAVEIATSVCELSEYRELSDLSLLAAAHAAKGEFAQAILRQEQVVEIASEPQKLAARKILELYQKNQPLDPKLLQVNNPDLGGSGEAQATSRQAAKGEAKQAATEDGAQETDKK